MTLSSALTACMALIFVLALMGSLAFILKRLGLAGTPTLVQGATRRLSVVESMPLTPQVRAVIIRRDNTEHLVIIGPNGHTVVETGITDDHEK